MVFYLGVSTVGQRSAAEQVERRIASMYDSALRGGGPVSPPPAGPAARPTDSRGHIVELQSIRGLAAVLVLGGHALSYYVTPAWFGRLRDLSNGHAAVVMFFVLSGFVLTQSLRSKPANLNSVVEFYISRLFRIFPAIWAASTLGLLYLIFMHYNLYVPDTSIWFQQRFRSDRMDLLHIVASYGGMLAFILPPLWTIFIEIMASLMMPALAFAGSRRGWFWSLFAVLLVLSFTIGPRTYYSVLLYLVDFAIGASLCVLPSAVLQRLRLSGKAGTYALALSAFVLLILRPIFGDQSDDDPGLQLVEAGCAALMIALIVHGRARVPILRSKFLTNLGDVSYSLYLLHFVIMCVFAKLLALCLPMLGIVRADTIALSIVLLIATFAITLPVANLSYRFVEMPGLQLGKLLLRQLRRLPSRRIPLRA
jgi:peptidoglycan/LPS O-acetylase OafA/YrhL